MKVQANDFSPEMNLTVSPPVTFTHLVLGPITMVRVAAAVGAESPRKLTGGSNRGAAQLIKAALAAISNFDIMIFPAERKMLVASSHYSSAG